MIRIARENDVAAVARIYDAIIAQEEKGVASVGWQRGVYPTKQTAQDARNRGELYVLEDGGQVVASAIINQTEPPAYAECPWVYLPDANGVLVLHTLVVDPAKAGHGHGRAFVAFYEELAKSRGITCLRMDTNAKNKAARSLYQKLGYRETAIVPCEFNGIQGIALVCMEKQVL